MHYYSNWLFEYEYKRIYTKPYEQYMLASNIQFHSQEKALSYIPGFSDFYTFMMTNMPGS